MTAAGALAAPGLLVIVIRDGEPVWRAARGILLTTLVVAAWQMIRRGPSRTQAAVSLVLGVVATAVGAGIAVPHLTKVGPTLLGVDGLVLTVSGAVLLVSGFTGALRSLGGWRRVATAPPLTLTALVAVWCLGIAVAATNVPRTAVGPTPAGFHEVEVVTADGVRLAGWYAPSTNGAAIVLLHGAGSTRSGVVDHARVLADAGFGTLLLDARGHGRSEGRAMDFGWFGDADVAAATRFLADQPDVREGAVGAVGLSMGGEEAIGAAASDPRLAAVVAEGATGRTAADKAWLSEVHGWRGAAQEGIDRILYAMTDVLTDHGPPVSLREAVAQAAPTPVLLIAGGNVPDEEDAGRYIQRGAPQTVRLWVVPDTAHTGALDRHPAEWRDHVIPFLEDALSVSRPT